MSYDAACRTRPVSLPKKHSDQVWLISDENCSSYRVNSDVTRINEHKIHKSETKIGQMTLKMMVKVIQFHRVLKAMLDAYFVQIWYILVESFMRYCLKIDEIRHNYTKIVKNSAKIHFSKYRKTRDIC